MLDRKVNEVSSREGIAAAGEPLMRIRGVAKTFPGVRALAGVDLDIFAGEVHALCGENGAGKSTLMKILAGGIRPDSGEIRHAGAVYEPKNPRDARNGGVVLIHQEMSLAPDLSVAENIFLGSLPCKWNGTIDRRKLNDDAARALKACGYDIDPAARVGDLPIARQQMVEIARAAAFPCSVVVFDEPTATLTEAEAESLFRTVERLRKNNVAVIYISHKMKEIFRLSDRISVLRDGETQATLRAADTDEAQVMSLMIGRTLDRRQASERKFVGNEVLAVSGLSSPGAFEDVSFNIAEGEILGLYGLVGAGRSELAEAIFGLRPASGALRWQGRTVAIAHPRDAVALGIGLVPEDRKQQGLVLGAGGRANVILANLVRLSAWGLLRRARAAALYSEFAERLRLRSPSPTTAVVTLSGGNQQKVVLAKWLATDPRLLILDEPTRGIDVGAKDEVYKIIRELAASGMAVLLISSEMPEVLGLSDRIITMHHGQLTGEFKGGEVGEEDLIHAVMSTGHQPAGKAARGSTSSAVEPNATTGEDRSTKNSTNPG